MIRLLMALPLALGVALGLFTLMAWMVDNANNAAPNDDKVVSFNMVMIEREQAPQRRQRSAPPPPETPKRPPEAKPMGSQTAVISATPLPSIPSLGLDTAIKGIAINAPAFGNFTYAPGRIGSSKQAMPLYRAEPRYPSIALRQGLEGYVLMKFTIDTLGRPIDIVVVDSKPRRMFDKEALRALRKWKYQPQVLNGEAVAQEGQTARLEFKLNK